MMNANRASAQADANRASAQAGDGSHERFTALAEALAEARAELDRNPAAAAQHLERADVLLATEFAERGYATTSVAKGGLAPWQVARIEQHVANTLSSKFETAEAADLIGLSPSHFARAFKVSFGKSPHAFVMERRTAEAKRLMLESDLSLAEIAVECGLGDQAHLCHVFRRSVGASPANWRRATQGILRGRATSVRGRRDAEVRIGA